jgi:hypothetical protein
MRGCFLVFICFLLYAKGDITMAGLRLANTEETRRYHFEDSEDYVDLRAEITKREANGLLKFAPRKEDDLDGGLRFIERAFADLIVSWSLDAEPNVETYNKLDAASASELDRMVGTHLRAVLGTEAEAAEGKLED